MECSFEEMPASAAVPASKKDKRVRNCSHHAGIRVDPESSCFHHGLKGVLIM